MGFVRNGYGGSTFSFMWKDSALAAMRRMQSIGLNDFDIIMVPGHCWHDELDSTQRSTFAASLRAEGLRIESLNLPALDQNLVSCIPEARAHAVQLYTRAMQLNGDLGGRAMVVVPGRVSALFPPPQENSEGWLLESLESLLIVAERLDQRIYVESHPQTPIPTIDKLIDFLQKLPHDRLLVAYDVSNAEYVAEDQGQALRKLAGRLGQVHLSDGTRTHWRHDRVGLGTVDFSAVHKALAEIDFAGVSVLEIISQSPLEDIQASISSLSEIAKSIDSVIEVVSHD